MVVYFSSFLIIIPPILFQAVTAASKIRGQNKSWKHADRQRGNQRRGASQRREQRRRQRKSPVLMWVCEKWKKAKSVRSRSCRWASVVEPPEKESGSGCVLVGHKRKCTEVVIVKAEKKQKTFDVDVLISFPWSNVVDILVRWEARPWTRRS